MATVTRESIGNLNERIKVTVSKEDYLPSFEKALKNYAKNANIPGFRKGMVPSAVIRKMHGPAVFADEVLRSVEKGLTNYLQEEKLEIFAQPLPGEDNDSNQIDHNQLKDYTFNFEVGLKPELKLPELSSVTLPRYTVEVTDEMISNELDRMQMRLGKMTEPESVNNDENILNVTFTPCDAEGNVAEDATSKDNSLLVKYFTEAFRKQLTGKKKEDHLVFKLKDAFEDREREWVEKDLGVDANDPNSADRYFKMVITKVGHVEKREMDESFFNEVYPGKNIASEEDFRKEIRSEIEKYWAAQGRSHLHHELYHAMLANTNIEFPENFLKRWLQVGGDKPKSAEEVAAEFPTFINQLKWTLLSDKIVADNQLNVTSEEIRENMKQQVTQYFGSMNLGGGESEWLDEYVTRMMKDRDQVEGTYRRLITEKVFVWAENKLNPTEKKISLDEFQKLQQEHEHHHHG